MATIYNLCQIPVKFLNRQNEICLHIELLVIIKFLKDRKQNLKWCKNNSYLPLLKFNDSLQILLFTI